MLESLNPRDDGPIGVGMHEDRTARFSIAARASDLLVVGQACVDYLNGKLQFLFIAPERGRAGFDAVLAASRNWPPCRRGVNAPEGACGRPDSPQLAELFSSRPFPPEHMHRHPDSDLVAVLTGAKAFRDAIVE